MENNDNNTFLQEHENVEHDEFKYNFISMPWDDRSKKSKAGIILLLLSIIFVTVAGIINSFIMHYRGYPITTGVLSLKTGMANGEINCQLVKVEDYRFVARIHSMSTQELLCVGAVVGENSVLANGACVKNGQVRLLVGSANDHRCKKGFTVNVAEPVIHDGVIAKTLVLLSTYESMSRCVKVIPVATTIDMTAARAYVVGRSMHNGRTMSRQPVTVVGKKCTCFGVTKTNDQPTILCVEGLARCPVLAGDLLVQDGLLLGIALTSVYRKEHVAQVCFADLSYYQNELKNLKVLF